jgi:hypothetical protein
MGRVNLNNQGSILDMMIQVLVVETCVREVDMPHGLKVHFIFHLDVDEFL